MSLSQEAIAIQSLFYIQPKDITEGGKVAFTLNPSQRAMDEADTGGDLIIAKARQEGMSSVILAKFDIRCLGREGTHAVCISHEGESTKRLFGRAHYYLKHIKGPKPVFGKQSANDLHFSKTESSFYIGTAGSKEFGRGDTITDLHCSEYAFWDNPLSQAKGLFQAVPKGGRKYIESTGNGKRNDFYYIWKHAEAMGFRKLFVPWFHGVEYYQELQPHISKWKPDIPAYNTYMREMQAKFNLSDQQMYWYELKLRSLRENISFMQQEYPFEAEECFQATGGSVFDEIQMSKHPFWEEGKFQGYYCNLLTNHPKKGLTYVLGADPSGGTGNDDASMQVICIETGEQVFEFFNNRIKPISLAQLMMDIGYKYNTAYLITEDNNHGAAVVPHLVENYPKNRIYKSKLATISSPAKYGWHNSQNSKHALIGTMQEELDQIKIYGKQTITELEEFEEIDGKLEGDSDNMVIATGLALLGFKKFEHLRDEYNKPKDIEVAKPKVDYTLTTLESILGSISSNRKKSQVGRGYPNG